MTTDRELGALIRELLEGSSMPLCVAEIARAILEVKSAPFW